MLTLWLFNIAMENGSFIDDLPIKKGRFYMILSARGPLHPGALV